MAKHGKKYRAALAKAPKTNVSLDEAVKFIKANAGAKFDESVDISLTLGVDPTKSDQSVRGTVVLPHGTGKKVRVVVFAAGAQADQAREAGADAVGYEDLIEKIKGGWTDFDVAISSTDAMKLVRTIARVLGPRGLMPNPKTGTVTDDIAPAVAAAKGGRVEFRMDRIGNLCCLVGKRSFDAEKLVQNALAVLDAVKHAKPPAAKGTFIKRVVISSTMGIGIRVTQSAE